MLPLHTSFRNLLSIPFFLIILASCSSTSKKNTEIIKALNESIETSNKWLEQSSNDILIALNDKQNDIATVERAKYWYPKGELAHKISKEAFDYVEALKRELASGDDAIEAHELFKKLINYKIELLNIDSTVAIQLNKTLLLFTQAIDSSKREQQILFDKYFNNLSNVSMKAMLSKLQNNIKTNEEKIIRFCFEQTGKVVFGPCSPDLPIVVQSSTVVQPGEKIEIITGICSFYTRIEPEVFVYEKRAPIGTDGVAISKFKAESKPGKYYVPVKINYTDQDGRQQTVQKEIEYTVANIQKQ
jgi:hypothetical protein